MRLEGTIGVAAPPRAVWDAALDPMALASCVPGVRSARRVDGATFEGEMELAVGPMRGEFTFTASIVEATFPDRLVVLAEGRDSVTGSRLTAEVHASMHDADGGMTDLAYDGVIAVKGRLAILGEMVLRATASLVVSQVARCLRDRLEPADVGARAQG